MWSFLSNIFNGNNIKEEFLPNYLNDKINQNSIIVKNIKNNIYIQVKTIVEQLKVSNDVILLLRNQPSITTSASTPASTPVSTPASTPASTSASTSVPAKKVIYNNVNTGYAYLDGYNSTIYNKYSLYDNCPANTFGCITNNQKDSGFGTGGDGVGAGGDGVGAGGDGVGTGGNGVGTGGDGVGAGGDGVSTNGNGAEEGINKLMTFNKDYIKLILTSLEDSIYNMHQNIFDLEGKNDTQVEINTYHLEMLIYTQFLFKKLEKTISNPIELNIMLVNILSKINEQLQ